MDDTVRLGRAALHLWEEPCISGKNGSGTVFFAGCNLRCVYCQNHEISAGGKGKSVSVERLSEIFLELQEKGAECSLEEICEDIEKRDHRDMTREISPLRQAEDAILVDSSEMSIEEVVAKILQIVRDAKI